MYKIPVGYHKYEQKSTINVYKIPSHEKYLFLAMYKNPGPSKTCTRKNVQKYCRQNYALPFSQVQVETLSAITATRVSSSRVRTALAKMLGLHLKESLAEY